MKLNRRQGGILKGAFSVFLGFLMVLFFLFVVLPLLGLGGLAWLISKAPDNVPPPSRAPIVQPR